VDFSDHTAGVPPVLATPSPTIKVYDKKILIARPWYQTVHPITAFCVDQLSDRRRTAASLCYGDAFVAHTRNHIIDEFLKSDLEWVLMVDSDMVIPFGNAAWFRTYTGWENYPEPFASFNAIDRLLYHGKTLVGALYFGRHPKGFGMFAESRHPKMDEVVRSAPKDVLHQTKWVATGCLLAHRRVFEDIEKKYPRLARGADGTGGQWFTSSEHKLLDSMYRIRETLLSGQLDGNRAYRALEQAESALSDARNNSTLGMGEDVTLCIRAGEAGHPAFVDFGLLCGHIGTAVYGPKNTGQSEKVKSLIK
jgi:hypothetical protein